MPGAWTIDPWVHSGEPKKHFFFPELLLPLFLSKKNAARTTSTSIVCNTTPELSWSSMIRSSPNPASLEWSYVAKQNPSPSSYTNNYMTVRELRYRQGKAASLVSQIFLAAFLRHVLLLLLDEEKKRTKRRSSGKKEELFVITAFCCNCCLTWNCQTWNCCRKSKS